MGTHILWALIFGFLTGVFVRSFVALGTVDIFFPVIIGGIAFAFAYLDRSKRRALFLVAIACVSLTAGMFRMQSALAVGDAELTARVGSTVVLSGIVADDPDVREGSVRVTIDAKEIIYGTSTIPIAAGVLAIAPAHTDVAYGDHVRAEGKLILPEAFEAGMGRTFDYPLFLAKDGILYQLSFSHIEKDGGNDANFLKAGAIGFKHHFLDGLRAVLPEPEAGLAGGITVGDKRSIGKELSEDFRQASLVHIVVLSGYNITLILNAARAVLGTAARSVQFGVSGALIFFIILMTGGAASAVRAGAMAMIAVFARSSGRVFLAGRILAVVAAAMVAWNPWVLAFDPGFQLSVLATAGLIIFTPLFSARLTWLTERFGLREIVSSTLGTQITVLPLLLYQNGLLSLVALPSNILALVAVPYAMGLSIFAAAVGAVAGSYAVPLALPAYALLAYIIAVAQFFASLPFAAVSIPAFSAWWLAAAYALLIAGYISMKRKKAGATPAKSN